MRSFKFLEKEKRLIEYNNKKHKDFVVYSYQEKIGDCIRFGAIFVPLDETKELVWFYEETKDGQIVGEMQHKHKEYNIPNWFSLLVRKTEEKLYLRDRIPNLFK